MQTQLKGKKLLMLGGVSYASYVKDYADQNGFSLFSAGSVVNEEMKKHSKDFFITEATDVQAICDVVKHNKIDGIVSLGNEDIINSTIKVCEKMNLSFYLDDKNWRELQDKKRFKQHCKEFGIDTVLEYSLPREVTDEELKNLPYPIVFKPTDSCGSKGITICYNFLDVKKAIKKALRYSRSQNYIVEKYMQCPEFIVSYIFVDGNVYVWMLGDRYMNTEQKGYGALSNLSVFPSRYSELYFNNVHSKMLALLKKYGPKNGTMFIQAFIDDDKIRFFDPGLRFCGTLDTIIYDYVCGVNPLHWMVNHSLTGKMCSQDELEKLDWKLRGLACAQLSILIKPGRISKIEGIETVKAIKGVINVVQLLHVDDVVDMIGTLQQVLLRVHIVADSKKQIDCIVKNIYNQVIVEDENKNDMKLPYFNEK